MQNCDPWEKGNTQVELYIYFHLCLEAVFGLQHREGAETEADRMEHSAGEQSVRSTEIETTYLRRGPIKSLVECWPVPERGDSL